jgi:cytoskeletal protein CcmA (bactofilin family)
MFSKKKRIDSDSVPPSAGEQKMFDKGAPSGSTANSNELNAFLNKGSEFDGKLSFDGSVRIDGIFNGEITAKGELQVGESGKIEAEVKVGSLIVSGLVKGDIKASQRIQLTPTAKVYGDIATPKLAIAEGAIFEGTIKMESLKFDNAQPKPIAAKSPAKDQDKQEEPKP